MSSLTSRIIDRLRRVEQTRSGLRQGEVTATSPLKVSIGGGASVLATALDGVELQVGDRVSVEVQGTDFVVLGRNTDDPQDAGGGGVTYSAGDGLDLTGSTFSTDLKSGGGLKIDATELAADVGSGSTQVAAGNDSRFPTTGQKNALAGTSGTPGSSNQYVTTQDSRLSDARTPSAHAASHKSGGSDQLLLNEFGAPSANVPMNTKKFTGLTPGTGAGDSAEYSQMIAGDVAAQRGFTLKSSVYAASIAALPAHSRAGNVLTATANGFLAPAFGTLKFAWASGSSGSSDGQFNDPRDVAVDSSGNIFVLDRGNSRVQKFNSSGVYQSKFGSAGAGNGQFSSATGIAVDSSDRIYVLDGTRVQRFSSAGSYQTTLISGLGSGIAGTFGLHVDSSGNIYVTTAAPYGPGLYEYWVQKHNSSGTQQWAVGGLEGSGDGEFDTPTAIATDGSGNVFVADGGNNRVQKLNGTNGGFLSKFGAQGPGDGQFAGPAGIDIDSGNNIWVSDFSGRVQKFNSSGTYQETIGGPGTGNGGFYLPRGLAITSGGDLIVADSLNNRVQRFTALTLTAGQSVLVRHEGSGTHAENNIYSVTNAGSAGTKWVLTLRPDMATGYAANQSMVIAETENGTENRVFILNTPDPITVWSTPLTWNRFEPGGPPSPHAANHSPGGPDPIPGLDDLMELLSVQNWVEIGSAGAPAFQNSWGNSGGGTNTAAFYKDPGGVVHLKGRITGGSSNTTAFTLPTGYRPPGFSAFGTVANNAFGQLTVSAGGPVNPIVSTWISLDGISFRAAT